jgi:hypothetical protein
MLVVSISGYSADNKAPEIVNTPEIGQCHRRGTISPGNPYIKSMPLEEQIDSGTIERLKKQGNFLLRMYRAELAKNPTSPAAESARSNVMALRHTIEQIHGRGR